MVLAIIDALHIQSYAGLSFGDGSTAVERAVDSAASLSDELVLLVRPQQTEATADSTTLSLKTGDGRVSLPESVKVFEVRDTSAAAVLTVLAELSAEAEAVLYKRADEPWMMADEASLILSEHVKYRAHYSFADGYPAGSTPVFFSPSLPRLLAKLVEGDDDTAVADWLFTVLQRDINSFDVETLLSPVDFRMLRITFRCDTRANYVLCSRFQPILCDGVTGSVLPKDRYVRAVESNYGRLRTLPLYMSVEVTTAHPQTISYLPDASTGVVLTDEPSHMAVGRFTELVNGLSAYSPEATVGICMWGEPLLHPDFPALVEAVCDTPGLSMLVETSGIGRPVTEVVDLAKRYGNRVRWIVALDAIEEDIYRELRGDGFSKARAFAETMIAEVPAYSYVPAVRMKETEAHLETFWRYWKEKTDHIIIQKYDDFCGLLPPRKVTDLSPVRRFPCWHNKRDLYVRIDGTVPRCREDVRSEHALGNLYEQSFEDIWESGDAVHRDQVAGRYTEICEHCDEYYTFNF